MFKSPHYNRDYRVFDVPDLLAWSREVRTTLLSKPDGPHRLVTKIFGYEVTEMLAGRGHFGVHRQRIARAESSQRLQAGPSSSRSPSVRPRDEDWESDEDSVRPASQRLRYE